MIQPVWLSEFRDRVTIEFDTRPCIATLATVDDGGRPRARSIVCRKFADDGSVWMTSDARSQKNQQIRKNPFGELVIYLPAAREQYRIAGDLVALSDRDERELAWREQSEATRAMFLWGGPGATVRQDVTTVSLDASAALPSTFELLILSPDRVEHLDLKPLPHQRRIWERVHGWAEESIDPW